MEWNWSNLNNLNSDFAVSHAYSSVALQNVMQSGCLSSHGITENTKAYYYPAVVSFAAPAGALLHPGLQTPSVHP